jgi:hypothetical protein
MGRRPMQLSRYGPIAVGPDVLSVSIGGYPMTISYKPEVIADSSGTWTGNALRFGTEQEARDYADELSCRWTAVREFRVIPSEDPVNYRWTGDRAEPLEN